MEAKDRRNLPGGQANAQGEKRLERLDLVWPKELLPLMVPLEKGGRKTAGRFFSVVDKVKAYILSQNLLRLLELYQTNKKDLEKKAT